MTWQLSPAHADFPGFAAQWDELNQHLFDSHPLLDSTFVQPLIELYGPSSLLLAREYVDGRLRSAALVRPLGVGVWRLFAMGPIQMTPSLMAPDADWNGLMRALPGLVVLLNVMMQDPDVSHLQPTPPICRAVEHAHTTRIKLSGDFDSYWNQRPRSLRQNANRYRRRLEQSEHVIEWRTHTQPQAIAAAVDRYGELESRGWKGGEGTALHPDNLQGQFFRRVLTGFAEREMAYGWELYIDGQLAAARLAIASPQMMVMLKTTYDEALANLAPGVVLLHEVVQQAFAAKRHQAIEFYTNASKEQMAWSTDSRWIRHFELYANPLSARVLSTLHDHGINPRRAAAIGAAATAATAVLAAALSSLFD